ncbi:protein of unknown function [Xenorhabdus poinarii G6]|uniref:Uncharacterized protein n=1 Tax=Xenorhabdus poinarii G6 TaxID=1354304 RepID=A0A068R2Q5_9GAMM|nr:protein of unknown function [Xenorhabdus poinarii G6]
MIIFETVGNLLISYDLTVTISFCSDLINLNKDCWCNGKNDNDKEAF